MNTRNQMATNIQKGQDRRNKLAYRDGYLHASALEQDIPKENQIVRDNNNAARRWLCGISFTAIAALTGAAIFLLLETNQPSTTPPETAPFSSISQP